MNRNRPDRENGNCKGSELGKRLVPWKMDLTIYIYCTDSHAYYLVTKGFHNLSFSHLTVPQQTSLALVKPFHPLFTKNNLLLSWHICYNIPQTWSYPTLKEYLVAVHSCPVLSYYRHFWDGHDPFIIWHWTHIIHSFTSYV